ncbi:TetR/AcrR family transcriptional regulator [Saccharicrinis sp. FJH62]|uniref:TetR/AcrR family transcriptional regulator n=1 Tax=Saccharicrinis sp. FJH62 TaxID=3344657 RepID=UPI0035D3E85A
MNNDKRSYNNTRRAKEAGNTKNKIIKTVGLLWTKHSLKDITLEMIAKESGVTIRTILRKFGSKEMLLEECVSLDAPDIMHGRETVIVGDVDQTLQTLLSNYESMGEAAVRTINLEPELDIARKIGEEGRKKHREWCARMFAPYLPKPDTSHYETDLTAFIACTEIYLWKLMRKDLKMGEEQTLAVFKKMVEGLISLHTKSDKK